MGITVSVVCVWGQTNHYVVPTLSAPTPAPPAPPPHPLQVNQVLEVGDRSQGTNKYTAMSKWMQQLQTSHATVLNKLV